MNPQIQHISRLLDDDDPGIRRILMDTLLEHSLDIIFRKDEYLTEMGENSRNKFADFLTENHFTIVQKALSNLMSTCLEDIDLESAAVIISYWKNPQIIGREITEQLDEIAQRVERNMPDSGHPLGFIDHINDVLFRELGFRGNTTDYYNPENSFLYNVINTKKGIPITISLVYLLTAKRIGLPILGVPMPAHFIVKYESRDDEVFFDPYARGKIYSRKDCIEYLKNAYVENPENVLSGCNNYDIVLRILNNIQLVYSSYTDNPQMREEAEKLYSLVEQFFNESSSNS